jgi:hypothetical protein
MFGQVSQDGRVEPADRRRPYLVGDGAVDRTEIRSHVAPLSGLRTDTPFAFGPNTRDAPTARAAKAIFGRAANRPQGRTARPQRSKDLDRTLRSPVAPGGIEPSNSNAHLSCRRCMTIALRVGRSALPSRGNSGAHSATQMKREEVGHRHAPRQRQSCRAPRRRPRHPGRVSPTAPMPGPVASAVDHRPPGAATVNSTWLAP